MSTNGSQHITGLCLPLLLIPLPLLSCGLSLSRSFTLPEALIFCTSSKEEKL